MLGNTSAWIPRENKVSDHVHFSTFLFILNGKCGKWIRVYFFKLDLFRVLLHQADPVLLGNEWTYISATTQLARLVLVRIPVLISWLNATSAHFLPRSLYILTVYCFCLIIENLWRWEPFIFLQSLYLEYVQTNKIFGKL